MKLRREILQGDSLHQLSDGLFGKQINEEILRVYSDLDDRGQDGKKRTLVVQLDFAVGSGGAVSITPKVQAKLPPQQGYQTTAKLDNRAGGMVFKPDAPENPDQMTTNDLDQQEGD